MPIIQKTLAFYFSKTFLSKLYNDFQQMSMPFGKDGQICPSFIKFHFNG